MKTYKHTTNNCFLWSRPLGWGFDIKPDTAGCFGGYVEFQSGNKVQVDTDLIITRPQTTSQIGQVWINGECGELIVYGDSQSMVNYCEGHVTISMTRAIDGILIDRLDENAVERRGLIEYLGEETAVVSAVESGGLQDSGR